MEGKYLNEILVIAMCSPELNLSNAWVHLSSMELKL